MFKSLLVIAALALLSVPALAQNAPPAMPQPPLDQQVEQAQMRFLAAQSDFYLASARKLQSDLAAAQKQVADVQAWWADCVKSPDCVAWVNQK